MENVEILQAEIEFELSYPSRRFKLVMKNTTTAAIYKTMQELSVK